MLTNTERDEIKKALEAATPSPWEWYEDDAEVIDSEGVAFAQLWWKDGKPRQHEDCIADGVLIANAPTWLKQQDEMIEQLLAEVERWKAKAAEQYTGWSNIATGYLEQAENAEAEVRAKDAEIEKLQQLNNTNYKRGTEFRDALEIAVEALKWYGEDEQPHSGSIATKALVDRGQKARTALDRINQSQVSKE